MNNIMVLQRHLEGNEIAGLSTFEVPCCEMGRTNIRVLVWLDVIAFNFTMA